MRHDRGELKLGNVIQDRMLAGQIHYYTTFLDEGDSMLVSVVQSHSGLQCRTVGPDNRIIRFTFPESKFSKKLFVLAETAGPYKVELEFSVDSSVPELEYLIHVYDKLDLKQRLQPDTERRPVASPLLSTLYDQNKLGNLAALNDFWKSIEARGAPLVESLESDHKSFSVTFLWRARSLIRNVVLLWNGEHPLVQLRDTDVWFKTMKIRAGARILYQLAPNYPPLEAREAATHRLAVAGPDPLNRYRRLDDNPFPNFEQSSVLELPGASNRNVLTSRNDLPKGTIRTHPFESMLLGNRREISVYVPAPRYSGEPHSLIVLFDGPTYLSRISIATILDELIADNRMPPAIAILIPSPSAETRWRELRCNSNIGEALIHELIPQLGQHYPIESNPARTVIGGFSRGGLTAAWVALRFPERFGNVLSQSGSFWWAPDGDAYDRSQYDSFAEPNWLAKQFVASPPLPIRFCLQAGIYEGHEANEGNILNHTRHLRDVLLAKGYTVVYQEGLGGHDPTVWRNVLSDGLLALTSPFGF